MKNKFKAYIHIGTAKTGTTTLQEFFHINREVLSQLGIFYPKTPGLRNHRKLSAYALDTDTFEDFHRNKSIHTLDEKITFEKAFEKAFCEELGTHSSHDRLLLSSEHFHSRLLNESELVKLKRLLDPYVKEYKIIVYLRAQIDVVTSLYSTGLKSGVIKKLEDVIKNKCNPGNQYYNYQDLLQRWADLFGEENMIVRLYDPKEFKEGSLIEDFLDTIDLRNNPATFQLPDNQNRSLSHTGQKIYRIFNYALLKTFNLKNTKVHKIFKRIMNRFFIGKAEKPDIMFAKQVQAQFDSSNQEVKKRWFPDRRELFDINWEKYQTSTNKRNKG